MFKPKFTITPKINKALVEIERVRGFLDAVKLIKGKKGGSGPPAKKVSIQDMIHEIKKKFTISDDEALYIKEVTEEKMHDEQIQTTIATHQEDVFYLKNTYSGQVNSSIQESYEDKGRYEELADPKYIDPGAIFDMMALTVIYFGLHKAKASHRV